MSVSFAIIITTTLVDGLISSNKRHTQFFERRHAVECTISNTGYVIPNNNLFNLCSVRIPRSRTICISFHRPRTIDGKRSGIIDLPSEIRSTGAGIQYSCFFGNRCSSFCCRNCDSTCSYHYNANQAERKHHQNS